MAGKRQPSSEAKFEVLIGVRFEGPFDEGQLKALHRSGRITSQSEVRRQGEKRFVRLASIFKWAKATSSGANIRLGPAGLVFGDEDRENNPARSGRRPRFATYAEELAGENPEAESRATESQTTPRTQPEPQGTFGKYWWTTTKVLFWISVVIGLVAFGYRGMEAIVAVILLSLLVAPVKAVFWAGLYWLIKKATS